MKSYKLNEERVKGEGDACFIFTQNINAVLTPSFTGEALKLEIERHSVVVGAYDIETQ